VPDDIETVVAIEREAFTTPWQPETFAGLIDREAVELTVMADEAGEVVGYSVLWCILDQGELANIAITPTRRGGGLGARLLEHVLGVAAEKGVEKVFLEVRASNEAALRLYRRFGFVEAGRRANYYEQPREDALVMVATLTSTP
jgi:ribosomal-protein-alanine N-acetyltransferase